MLQLINENNKDEPGLSPLSIGGHHSTKASNRRLLAHPLLQVGNSRASRQKHGLVESKILIDMQNYSDVIFHPRVCCNHARKPVAFRSGMGDRMKSIVCGSGSLLPQ